MDKMCVFPKWNMKRSLSSDPAASLDLEPRDAEASCHCSNGMSRSSSHPTLPKDAQR